MHQLQSEVESARQVYEDAAFDYGETLRAIDGGNPYIDQAIKQKQIEIERFYVTQRDATTIVSNIKETQEVIKYLRSHQGLITFEQTLMRDRRLLELPRLRRPDVNMNPIRVRRKMRM
jgi:hypothetical protein